MRAKSRYYEFGPFRLEPQNRLLWRAGQELHLYPQTFDLLVALVDHAGTVMTATELHDRIWGKDINVSPDSLHQAVSSLRKALLDGSGSGRYIDTVPKRGYRFVAEVREIKPRS